MTIVRNNVGYKCLDSTTHSALQREIHLAKNIDDRKWAPLCTPRMVIGYINRDDETKQWVADNTPITCVLCAEIITNLNLKVEINLPVAVIERPENIKNITPTSKEGGDSNASTQEKGNVMTDTTNTQSETTPPAEDQPVAARIVQPWEIAPDTRIGDIVLEALPLDPSKQRIIKLPGAQFSEDNRISMNQQHFAARFMQEETDLFDASMTWAEGMAKARQLWLKGRQWDLQVITAMSAIIRSRNAGAELTEKQMALCETLISVLSGNEVHWDKAIAAKLAVTRPQLREAFLENYVTVLMAGTNGEMQRSMRAFNARFGLPVKRTGLGDPMDGLDDLGMVSSGGSPDFASLIPATGGGQIDSSHY